MADDSLSTENLRRINPFSRHVWQRGSRLYPALRQQLIHDDMTMADDLALRITLCLKMTAAFHPPAMLDKIRTALARRYRPGMVHHPYVAALNHQRRFDDALQYCAELHRTEQGSTGARLLLIDQFFIAGFPGKAIQLINKYLTQIAQTDRQQAQKLATILIEAGQLDWLRAQHRQLAERQPRVAQADRLSGDPCNVPIYCISLPNDHRRLATTRHFIDHGGPFHIVEAIAGRILPEVAKAALIRGAGRSITDSEIGCSLSHIKAWEMVAASLGKDDFALIVEDDARFMFGAPRGLNDILRAAEEVGTGLIFINRRACGATIANLPADEIRFANVDAATHPTPADWRPLDPGWGADGYLVTGAMARRLARIWQQIGILGAVDWQLQMICHRYLQPWHRTRALKNLYNQLNDAPDLPLVTGFTTNTPLIDTRDHGFSSINAG